MNIKRNLKIGILTFHAATNVGANLQAYALCAFLNGIYPRTELVDFYPNSYQKKRSWKRRMLHFGKLMLIPSARKNMRVSLKFERFQRLYPRISAKKCYGDVEFRNFCAMYDVLISGSDQILNLSLSGNTFAYYLPFDGVKKISYASSFGRASISDLEKWAILSYFPDFDALSFREESGYEIASSLTDLHEKNVVVDPTFLLSKREWEAMTANAKKPKGNYILVYSMEKSSWFERAIDTVAGRHPDCKIILIDGCGSKLKLSCHHKTYGKASPLDFLNLVSHARIVVTNSFHGIAFSILFEKPFYACAHSKRNTRLQHILGLTGDAQNLIGENSADLNLIDGEASLTRLEPSIKKSKEFLLTAIDKCYD